MDIQHDPQKIVGFCERFQLAANDIVCIDEAGFYVGDRPRKGYAPKGKRLDVLASRSFRHVKYTLLMAVSRNGVVHHEILDHNCRKADFIKFIENLPVERGCSLLMDNVAFHKSRETLEALRKKGYDL